MKLRATPFTAFATAASLKPLNTRPQGAPRSEAQIRTGRSDLSLFGSSARPVRDAGASLRASQVGSSAAKPAGRTEAEIRNGRSDLSLFTGSSARPSAPLAGDGFVGVKPGPQTSVAAPATPPGEADDVGKAVGSVAQALLDSMAAPFKFLGSLFGF